MSTDNVTRVMGAIGGIDVDSLVSSLLAVERTSLIQVRNEIVQEQNKLASWTDVQMRLATLRGKTQQLTSSNVWQQMAATVTQTTGVLSATALSTASEATYDVNVSHLARSHRIGSDAQASASEALALAGDFTIGGELVTVDAADSLRDIADKINAAASGMAAASRVRASVVDTTLVIERVQTGETAITLSDGTDGILAGLGVLDGVGGIKNELQTGLNLSMTVNGVSVARERNTGLTDVIDDVTLNVTAAGASRLDVARDRASIKTLLQDLVAAYNSAMSKIKQENIATVAGSNTVTARPLVGDSLLRGIGARCRDLVTGTAASDPDISADLDSLRKLGIVTSGADNALTINSAALDAALQNHFEDVEALIRDPDAGIVTKLDTYLSGLLNASDGTLKQRQDTINDNIGRRNATIARMERYLTQYENSLYDQFAYLQNVLNELNQQKSYLSGILGT